ncbi:MAG TPA: DNA-binding protein [Bacteroidales bacterium]|jgi:hypothetical protein|nr:DNA-binding protein [Bacteroidales bacterium]
MAKGKKVSVKGTEISIFPQNEIDFISLTDMTAGFKEGSGLIGKWITNKNTLEYLGIWEKINNSDFNYPEFGVIEQESGINRLIMSVGQWIERTNAFGMLVKAGRYGGTYAIKENLIPKDLSKQKQSFVYASEADLLNLALFNKTAKQWRSENSDREGNMRDYATLEQLVVLSNMESMNAELIKSRNEPQERLVKLNQMAISQMKVLIENTQLKKLK